MPLPMVSTPRSDDPAGTARPLPSWVDEVSEGYPVPLPGASAQLPLFPPSELPPAAPRARRPRLPGRLKALLGTPRAAPSPDTSGLLGASWPDSFFDADACREP
jgi:hypothetical protein